jgi:hypothetical protein
MNILEMKQVNKKEVRISVLFSAEKLAELETHLKNFLRNIYRSAVTSPIEQAKTTGINLDYLSSKL